MFVRVGYGIGPALLYAIGVTSIRLLRVQLILGQGDVTAYRIRNTVLGQDFCTPVVGILHAVFIVGNGDFRRHRQRAGLPLHLAEGAGGIICIPDGTADCIFCGANAGLAAGNGRVRLEADAVRLIPAVCACSQHRARIGNRVLVLRQRCAVVDLRVAGGLDAQAVGVHPRPVAVERRGDSDGKARHRVAGKRVVLVPAVEGVLVRAADHGIAVGIGCIDRDFLVLAVGPAVRRQRLTRGCTQPVVRDPQVLHRADVIGDLIIFAAIEHELLRNVL